MYSFIIDAIEYLASYRVNGDIGPIEAQIGKTRLRTALIKVLGWFKDTSTANSTRRPLRVNDKVLWGQDVALIIGELGGASDILRLGDGQLDFQAEVSSAVRDSIRAYVDNHYNPPVFTHVKSSED